MHDHKAGGGGGVPVQLWSVSCSCPVNGVAQAIPSAHSGGGVS